MEALMTEEINTEEEIINNAEETTPEATKNEAGIPVISSADQVEAITTADLFQQALLILHSRPQKPDDFVTPYYVDSLYKKHFGEKYSPEAFEIGIEDERQQGVITDYLYDRLQYIKTQATSLNKDNIDEAFEDMFRHVGYNITIPNSVESIYDEVFIKRAGNNEFLLEDYQVLKINRDLWHIYNGKTSVTEVSKLITSMEDLSLQFDDNDNHDFKIVNKELMAQFYYNVSEIYEKEANSKSNIPDVNKWHYRAMEYKKKALDTTSCNIAMVSNIRIDWKDYPDYKPGKIIEACNRIIDNKETTEIDKYRAHKLCGDTLISHPSIRGFSSSSEQTEAAISHYRAALAHTQHTDDRILNDLSKAQKNSHPEDYVITRLEIAETLEGRPRIREYSQLADFVKNKDFKAAMYKSCINEFHELPYLEIEDKLLYDGIDKKLREIISPEDSKTIAKLDKLKKKFGTADKKQEEFIFPIMSSKGHDYFS